MYLELLKLMASLPFISPLSYTAAATLSHGQWHVQISVKGNAIQSEFGEKYGESGTPAFALANNISLYFHHLHWLHLLSVKRG